MRDQTKKPAQPDQSSTDREQRDEERIEALPPAPVRRDEADAVKGGIQDSEDRWRR
jgi:hypothetical protein